MVLEEVAEDEGCVEKGRRCVAVAELRTGVGKVVQEEDGGGGWYHCFAFATSLDDLGVLLLLHEEAHVVHRPRIRCSVTGQAVVLCADLFPATDSDVTSGRS